MLVTIRIQYALLIPVLFFAMVVKGQVDTIDNNIWLEVNPHFDINEKLEYHGTIGYRTSTLEDGSQRIVIKPTLSYHWKDHFDWLGGLGFLYTQLKADYYTIELRPFQGVRIGWPSIWRVNFKHRAIIEERFLWNNNDNFDPALRLRYRLKTKLPLNHSSMQIGTLYIPMSIELFANSGGEEVDFFRNQNRTMIGLGYVFKGKWVAEFELTFQKARITDLNKFSLSERIFRFKLTYNGWVFGE